MRILLIALLAVAALPAAADAATVSRTGGTLRYQAGKGERISGSVTETSSGGFQARSDKNARQRLTPGPGCKRSRPREIRCSRQGVARVEISLKRARTTTFFIVQDVRVAVAAVGSAGTNSMLFSRTPDFTYDGGPKRDAVDVRDSPGGHSTIRLGAGADFFDGQPPSIGAPDSTATFTVDGGPGRDYLMGGPEADSLNGGTGSDTLVCNGADTLTGGAGADTVLFGSDPNHDDGAISVTLDGQRNDGSAGQNALVGADIENASVGGTSPPSDYLLVGNDGPNVLVGPGTVRGLGGNDTLISNNGQGAGTTLDGGDGDDRIAARAWDTASASFATTPASVACGAGADIVFTNAAAPADCERVNVGMHVLGARSIGRNGVVRARIDCTDPRGCVMRGLALTRRGHEASIGGPIRVIKIPFGESRMASAQILPEIWKRRRHGRSLRVKLDPSPQTPRSESGAGPIGSYPRALTLRIRH